MMLQGIEVAIGFIMSAFICSVDEDEDDGRAESFLRNPTTLPSLAVTRLSSAEIPKAERTEVLGSKKVYCLLRLVANISKKKCYIRLEKLADRNTMLLMIKVSGG